MPAGEYALVGVAVSTFAADRAGVAERAGVADKVGVANKVAGNAGHFGRAVGLKEAGS